MFNWTCAIMDRMCACLGAICFSQFPQFFLQYTHQLSGHVAELKYQLSLIEHAALLAHKSLDQWVAKFYNSSDPDFALQGQLLKGMMERLSHFQQSENALQNGSLVLKPFLFARFVDKEIMYDTYRSFQFGLSFTVESACYALLGLGIGYSLFQCFRFLVTKTSKRFV